MESGLYDDLVEGRQDNFTSISVNELASLEGKVKELTLSVSTKEWENLQLCWEHTYFAG